MSTSFIHLENFNENWYKYYTVTPVHVADVVVRRIFLSDKRPTTHKIFSLLTKFYGARVLLYVFCELVMEFSRFADRASQYNYLSS